MIICIAKDVCEELLRKGGFQEPKVVFKKFKERQWLDHEGDRNTRKRKIKDSGTAVDVYAIRVFDTREDEVGKGGTLPKRTVKTMGVSKKTEYGEPAEVTDGLLDFLDALEGDADSD